MLGQLTLGMDLNDVVIRSNIPGNMTFSQTKVVAYGQSEDYRIEEGPTGVKIIVPYGWKTIFTDGTNYTTTNFSDFGVITYLNERADSYPYIYTATGVRTYGLDEDKNLVDIAPDGAGFHNSIFRGKNLGDSVTLEQWEAIRTGRFNDLYIGDYWLISNVHYRIAAFDYYYGIKYTDYECVNHHVVIVPDELISTNYINSSRTDTGAYYNSDMRTVSLSGILTLIRSAFGSGDTHILPITQVFVSALSSGRPSAVTAAAKERIWLMNEVNVYGTNHNSAKFDPGLEDYTHMTAHYTYDNTQYPLFRLDNTFISSNGNYWLRDTSGTYNDTNQYYSEVSLNRAPTASFQDLVRGIRPAFCLHGGDYYNP